MTKCPFQVRTTSFGSVTTIDRLRPSFLVEKELYLEATNRELQHRDNICKAVSLEVPTIEWQSNMILWYTNLEESEKNLVYDYTSYKYKSMNDSLRRRPISEAPLNDIIAKSIPLTTDVIVYRRITTDYLPDSGEFTHHGYLSVSFSASLIAEASCEDIRNHDPGYIIRIEISKGTRCLYIPSTEMELIFPHGSVLTITGKHRQTITCSDNTTVIVWMYDAVLKASLLSTANHGPCKMS